MTLRMKRDKENSVLVTNREFDFPKQITLTNGYGDCMAITHPTFLFSKFAYEFNPTSRDN